MSNVFHACMYLRISKEDSDSLESNSITNQKLLIKNYVSTKVDIDIVSEKVDDGYSGTNFERPAFLEMLRDIRTGKINCVIVKDLSRFGRSFIECGKFIDRIFPLLGVRFIAINDGYDSLEPNTGMNNVIIPFKNLLNDSYSRDISIKIKSNIANKRKNGDLVSAFTVYGYLKDINNKNRLIIDPYSSIIVERIFMLKAAGTSANEIAHKLNSMLILSPADYKEYIGLNYKTGFKTNKNSLWTAKTVTRILSNNVYTGKLEQGKTSTKNYKNKTKVYNSPADWIVSANSHDAIISDDLFYKCNNKPTKYNKTPLSGQIFCGKCGCNMKIKSSYYGDECYKYFVCSNKECKISFNFNVLSEIINLVTKKYMMMLNNSVLNDYKNGCSGYTDILTQHIEYLLSETAYAKSILKEVSADFKNGILNKDYYDYLTIFYKDRLAKIDSAILEVRYEISHKHSVVDCLNNMDISIKLACRFIDKILISDKNKIQINYMVAV